MSAYREFKECLPTGQEVMGGLSMGTLVAGGWVLVVTGCGEWTLFSWSGAARLVMGVARIGWVCGAGFHWDLV